MKNAAYLFENLPVYWVTVALTLAMALAPGAAQSGAYETGGAGYYGPRWSNDHHVRQGLIVRPGCVTMAPGASAEYIPGRDPYGHPAPPADTPKTFGNPLPLELELDVNVGTKHIGDKTIELHAGRFAFDPATNDLTLNGRRWQRDCLTSPK